MNDKILTHPETPDMRIFIAPPGGLADTMFWGASKKMNLSNSAEFALPVDIALKIVSSLQVSDVCSLGSCSRFLEELCGSDYVWECLSRERWPDTSLDKEFSAYESKRHELDRSFHPKTKGWRGFYRLKHEDMARKANLVAEYLQQQERSYESIDAGHYMKATEDLQAMHFSFRDVLLLLFKPKFNVLVNLVALHYCIMQLDLPAEYVMEALSSHKIEKRRICVQWKKLHRRFGLFGWPDKLHLVNVTLGDLVKAEGGVFLLLQRGVYNNWLQIQISAA